MRRVLTIALSFTLTLTAIVVAADHFVGSEARMAGAKLYWHRPRLLRPLVRPAQARYFVSWLGDSTLAAKPEKPSFMSILSANLHSEGVRGDGSAFQGSDFFHYYCILPHVLAAKPDLVVLTANFRTFSRGRRVGRAIDLCSALPSRDLPRTSLLPWHDRGVTLVRLAMTRALRIAGGESWLRFFEGLRILGGEWLAARVAPLDDGGSSNRAAKISAGLERVMRNFDEPITESHPVVRMMGATVAAARRHGVPVIVVALPIPYHALERHGYWDAERFAKRTAMLRSVVRSNGGTFVDLHLALLPGEFSDSTGHYTPAGAAHIARLLEPSVRDALGLPRRRRASPPSR